MRDSLTSMKLLFSSVSLALAGMLEAAQIVWGLFLIVCIAAVVKWNERKDAEDNEP